MLAAICLSPFAAGLATDKHLKVREEFSEKLGRVRGASSEAEVRKALGNPTRVIISSKSTPLTNPLTSAMWFYSDRRGDDFPSLGTVMFDADKKVRRIIGTYSPKPSLAKLGPSIDLSELEAEIHKCGGLIASKFRPSVVVRLCRKLRRLGFDSAMAVLREYARMRPLDTDLGDYRSAFLTEHRVDGNDGRLGVIVRTLLPDHKFRNSDIFRIEWYIGYYTIFFKDPLLTEAFATVDGWPVVLPQGVHYTNADTTELALLEEAVSVGSFPVEEPPAKPSEAAIRAYIDGLKQNCKETWAGDVYEKMIRQQLKR